MSIVAPRQNAVISPSAEQSRRPNAGLETEQIQAAGAGNDASTKTIEEWATFSLSTGPAELPAPSSGAGGGVQALFLAERTGQPATLVETPEAARALPSAAIPTALAEQAGSVRATDAVAAVEVVEKGVPSEAEVAQFVRDWFKLLDREAPEAEVLRHLYDEGLNFDIPGIKLRNHNDFKRTYGLLRFLLGDKTEHVMEEVSAKKIDDNTFDAHNRHRWKMKIFNLIPLSLHLDENWKVKFDGGNLKIEEYLGRFA